MNTPEAVAALAKALHEPHIKRDDADWRDCYEDDVDAIEHMLATIPDGWHLVPDAAPTSEREAEIRALIDAAETYSPTEWPQHWIDYRDLLALLDAERAARDAALAAGMLAARDFHMAAFRGRWPGQHTSSVIEECPNEMCVKHVAALRAGGAS